MLNRSFKRDLLHVVLFHEKANNYIATDNFSKNTFAN
jgi:hypothetical protein